MRRRDRSRVEIPRPRSTRGARGGLVRADRPRARHHGHQGEPEPLLVLKLGGELLEEPTRLSQVAALIARLAGTRQLGDRARRRA